MIAITGPDRSSDEQLTLARLERCYEGGVPAVVCTVDAEGRPNITYISRVHQVDADRVAISNQFMSKTSRNLAVNPLASLLLIDPVTYQEFHLQLAYERTERRGPVFERLRDDVDQLAEDMGLQDVFKLRAADIFRVTAIASTQPSHREPEPQDDLPTRSLDALTAFALMIDGSSDLDTVIDTAVRGIDTVLGYHHVSLLLLDESGSRLYTIASRGFEDANIGAEITLGDGAIGRPLARRAVYRTSGLRQAAKYSRTVRRSFEESGVDAGSLLSVPGLADVDSRIVVPIRSLGQLIGGIVVEEQRVAAFTPVDEHVLTAAATMLAGAIQAAVGTELVAPAPEPEPRGTTPPPTPAVDAITIRHFAVDGSIFVDGDYLIRGVAGRILRALIATHLDTGRVDFTNRELRLDPSLDLPGFKDNLESRLTLLRRRLDERSAPCRIEKTGRGRFRLDVLRPILLDDVDDQTPS